MPRRLLPLLLFGIAISQQVVSTTENRPFLRILAPRYICPDEQKIQNLTNRVTIGLQTKEGQRLKYGISIDFDILDGFQSQQHTLSIWKHVRQLQAKFAIQEVSDEISLKNQIEIDAAEVCEGKLIKIKNVIQDYFQLTPQVIYTFKIIGYDEKNIASEMQNFTMTYKGDELKASQTNVRKL